MRNLLEVELNALIETSKDNIVVTDGNGIVIRASSSCLSIYGHPAQSLIGQSVFELEKMGIFSPSVTVQVLRQGKECQLMQHTKTGRLVMASGFPVFDDEQRIFRVISFSHDLTELQQLKEKYEELQIRMLRYETEIEELREKSTHVEGIVINSESMRNVWRLIQRVARSDATVVFLGESGVGKSVLARALHNASERRSGPFIEINCGAIPESLFESELFGYEAGAFTGANRNGKPGIFELADKGTLFLDEIGEIPLAMQAKLLKVIQEKKVVRIGGIRQRSIDFRLIAATNRDLESMVKNGKLREDLYFRLNVIPIEIPPLRHRSEDICLLVHHYLKNFNEKYNLQKSFHPATLDLMTAYDWPGNVRQLENTVERLVLTVESDVIFPEHLPFSVRSVSAQPWEEENENIPLKEVLEKVERQWLKRAYERCRTTIDMAKYLGISQPSVVRKLQKYGIIEKKK